MLKQVRFLGSCVSTQHGSFSTGDVARFPADFAAHLVDELNVAEYAGKAEPEAAEPEAAQAEPEAHKAKPASKRAHK